jgi:hypothetical protein
VRERARAREDERGRTREYERENERAKDLANLVGLVLKSTEKERV